jgi:hypothetical protein
MTLTGVWGAFVLVLLALSGQPCVALRVLGEKICVQ